MDQSIAATQRVPPQTGGIVMVMVAVGVELIIVLALLIVGMVS